MNCPLPEHERWRVVLGDTLALLPDLPDESIDAVISDPPYGIDFHNQEWDGKAIRDTARNSGQRLSNGQAFERWTTIWATELNRVLKPGGHLLAFAAPRMAHRLTSGLEDSGLEVRDVLMWLYGQGMPKSRRLTGGQGTALKPFYEPIVLARRTPTGTVTDNIARHGTGALNTDACSIANTHDPDHTARKRCPQTSSPATTTAADHDAAHRAVPPHSSTANTRAPAASCTAPRHHGANATPDATSSPAGQPACSPTPNVATPEPSRSTTLIPRSSPST